jgi:hypothetical protein
MMLCGTALDPAVPKADIHLANTRVLLASEKRTTLRLYRQIYEYTP